MRSGPFFKGEKCMLTTQRLILRPWEIKDATDLYFYAKDPDIGPAGGWPPHTSVAMSEHVIANVFQKPDTFAITLKNAPEHPIGAIGLTQNSADYVGDNEAELGYWLGKPFWGQGVTPEAARAIIDYGFQTLQLKKIWLTYYVDNTQSERVAEKLGFTFIETRLCLNEFLQETALENLTALTFETWQKIAK